LTISRILIFRWVVKLIVFISYNSHIKSMDCEVKDVLSKMR